jgi:hypothetical protein
MTHDQNYNFIVTHISQHLLDLANNDVYHVFEMSVEGSPDDDLILI